MIRHHKIPDRKKVMLIFPPDWFPSEPYLSLPTLTATLRSAGHIVIQKDVNVEMFDWFFSHDFLQKVSGKINQRIKQLRKESTVRGLDEHEIEHLHALINRTPDRISDLTRKAETAKHLVRAQDFYDAEKLVWALNIFNEVMHTISLAYAPARICMPPMETNLPYKLFVSSELLKAVHDTNVNVYRDVYEYIVRPAIERECPDIIGISIAFKQQLFSSMTFCALIKEQFPHIHVTIGGNTVTRLRDVLPEKPDLFTLFDSAVIFEGETSFLRLVEALSNDGNLSKIPNLIYMETTGISMSSLTCAEDISELPPPDFDGLPLEKYFSPELILPYLATRGCYWGRCKFCDHGEGYTSGFRMKRVEQVIDEIRYLKNRYNARCFHFTDESYPPALFKRLTKKLVEDKVDIEWTTHLRFEKGLIDKEVWRDAINSGCKFLHFGFESGSECVLELMGKATTLDTMRRTLQLSSEAGIWNHVMGFFGFPGETYEDAKDSIKFMEENKEYIHSIGFGTFDLTKYAPIMKNLDKYGILYYRNPEWDLALNYYYIVRGDRLSIREAEQLLSEFEQNHYERWDLKVIIREYIFLYVAHYGTNRLPFLQINR